MKEEGKRRDVEKERYWRKVIGEAARSGVSIRRFCQQRRLKESQFYWWQRELKKRQQARALRRGNRGKATKSTGQATFALVSEDDGDLGSSGIELVLRDGRRLRIGRGVDEETLRTVVGVLDRSLPRTRTGRIWTHVGDENHPYTVYDYTPNRSRDGPVKFMKDFNGKLQADAYSGYEVLYEDEQRDVTEVACWAHARRKFYEAQSSDIVRSMVMLGYTRLLYDVERQAKERNLNPEGRLALRQAKSVPILDDTKAYLEREQPNVLPKSPEGQAFSYVLSNWDALMRYCEDGNLEIDNNGAERSLRGIAVGRKNWLFFGSDNGGRTAAILTSFLTTCKRLQINPFTYLRDIFQRISAHPAKHVDELLPDNWKTAQEVTQKLPT